MTATDVDLYLAMSVVYQGSIFVSDNWIVDEGVEVGLHDNVLHWTVACSDELVVFADESLGSAFKSSDV